jgi:hypothetical protein
MSGTGLHGVEHVDGALVGVGVLPGGVAAGADGLGESAVELEERMEHGQLGQIGHVGIREGGLLCGGPGCDGYWSMLKSMPYRLYNIKMNSVAPKAFLMISAI